MSKELTQLRVIGLSIGRNYYILQLRLPQTDAGLISGIVVIWIEIQLAYAIAASTLSASKSFTESFSSGFGQGFTRGKGEESYGLSGMSGKTPISSKDEKSQADSALSGGTRTDSLAKRAVDIDEVDMIAIPYSQTAPQAPPIESPLKLRPETALKTVTQVSAEPHLGTWQDSSSANTESSIDDMVIHQETAYEVQHDRAPILNKQHVY